MNLLVRIDLDAFCVIILAIILAEQARHSEKHSLEHGLFRGIAVSNIALLLADIAGWCFAGRPSFQAALAQNAANLVYFGLHMVPPYLWVVYVHLQVFHNEGRARRLFMPASLPLLVGLALTIATPFTGALFTIDAAGFYHRGPLLLAFMLCNYSYLVVTIALTVRNWRRIERRTLWPLLLFPLPAIVGGSAQAFFYGSTLVAPGYTLSILLIYVSIQQLTIKTDYLTGVFNRLQADHFLKQRILSSRSRGAFSGILIDVDDFKAINDHYGHAVGDMALEKVASLLRKAVRKDDFVARFGGDEFIIFLEICSSKDLDRSISRIREAVDDYNATRLDQIELGLSFGYAVYDPDQALSDTEFLKRIDALLYQDKASKQLIRA
jgi:diguanylate cyclase (GGDEF)-like protein